MTTITAIAPVTFLELEITDRCQLACTHCYAENGAGGSHGSMTVPWPTSWAGRPGGRSWGRSAG